MEIEIRRAESRFLSTYDGGVMSRHSFSFGSHYDPRNVGFASLVCNNDDLLPRRQGYDLHPHSNLEIVTWVLSGELHHRDSSGSHRTVPAGSVQRLSAGSGVHHSEYAGDDGTRFVQMWVLPDEPDTPPSYDVAAVGGGDVVLAGGGDALLDLGRGDAALRLVRLTGGTSLSDAPSQHVYVCRGRLTLETGEVLEEGDAARVTDASGLRLTGDAEALIWELGDAGHRGHKSVPRVSPELPLRLSPRRP